MPKINITVDVPEGKYCVRCLFENWRKSYCNLFRKNIESGFFVNETFTDRKCEDCLEACEKSETGKAKWITKDGIYRDTYECSCCNVLSTIKTKYCPNCGGKMEKER